MKKLTFIPLIFLLFGVNILYAHGYLTQPESRSYRCKLGSNLNCGPVQYEPQSVEGKKGFPGKSVPDGHIASANLKHFYPLDAQTSDRWAKNKISAGVQDFVWKLTAVHRTTGWQYFITKPDWDVNAPLTRESFDLKPFASFLDKGEVPKSPVTHSIDVPSRTGYQVILAVWTIEDTPMAFYQAIDVEFSGDDSQIPMTALNEPIEYIAPDAYVSGLMEEYTPDENGDVQLHMNLVSTADFLTSLILYAPSGEPLYETDAAIKEDSVHKMFLIKNAQAGLYSVEFEAIGQMDTSGNEVHHQYLFTVKKEGSDVKLSRLTPSSSGSTSTIPGYQINPSQAVSPEYDYVFPEGLDDYLGGDRVKHGKRGNIYECKPWPYEGYCQQWNKYSNQYEPGVGQYWKMAWKKVRQPK